jgi:hypothetical protein
MTTSNSNAEAVRFMDELKAKAGPFPGPTEISRKFVQYFNHFDEGELCTSFQVEIPKTGKFQKFEEMSQEWRESQSVNMLEASEDISEESSFERSMEKSIEKSFDRSIERSPNNKTELEEMKREIEELKQDLMKERKRNQDLLDQLTELEQRLQVKDDDNWVKVKRADLMKFFLAFLVLTSKRKLNNTESQSPVSPDTL